MFFKIILIFFAIFFPIVVFLVKDKPGAALAAMMLQVCVLGWPIATIWAIRTIYEKPDRKKNEQG